LSTASLQDFVVDRYSQISIKNCERGRRASTGDQVIEISRADQKAPKQFKKYLASGKNKELLATVLFAQWRDCDAHLLDGIELYVSHEAECHRLAVVDGRVMVTAILELSCDHEEADTRMVLHAKHASTSYNNVAIKSPDTHVLVLLVAHAGDIDCDLLFLTGIGNTMRTINATKIFDYYGADISQAPLGMHVFTGCDSVSAFKGKGEMKALQLVVDNSEFITAFKDLGIDFDLSDGTLKTLEKFVCHLYGQKSTDTVNEARYNMFRIKFTSDSSLPSNKDCLRHHGMRSAYQAAIHRRSLKQTIAAPSPAGHGWKILKGDLEFEWMANAAAPDIVLKYVHCKCKKSECTTKLCSCVNGGLSFNDM
jgi:hypothetical protein